MVIREFPLGRPMSRIVCAALMFAASASLTLAEGRGPTIAAAANLRYALPDLVAAYLRTGVADPVPRVSFGSSGNFFHQLRRGAPFELYLSADEDYVLKLAAEGRTRDRGALYAMGRLVILAPEGSSLKVDERLDGLSAALEDGGVQRFSIPNPEHAPYGRAAREVLEHRGLWKALEKRLVVGENASQAMQFTLSGAVDGGLVPYALALAPQVAAKARFVLIPADWHAPLRQRMVLSAAASDAAEAFYRFMRGSEARAILAHYGFGLPDRSAP